MLRKPNRRERRAAQLVKTEPHQHQIPQKSESKTNLLAWLRSCGFGAVLLGGLGLMKTFYLPSVIGIYVGLSLFCLDALFEKLQTVWKVTILATLIFLGITFTYAVVLHKSPMQYGYRFVDNDEVEMSIRNDSLEDDYTNFDMLVSPSQKESLRYVGSAQIVSGDHSCALVNFPNEIPNGHMSLVYSPDGKSLLTWSDSFRVRCDKIPHNSTIWIHAKIVTADPSKREMPFPAHPIGIPYGVGAFTAKFRTEKVNTKFTIY